MKNVLLLSLLICIASSCTSDNEMDPEFTDKQQVEKWKLVQMTSNIIDAAPVTGSNMDWQEVYQLSPDKTFLKFRQINDKIIEIAGTYSFVSLSNGTYLELVYKSDHELIGNCTSDNIELLLLSSENKLTATWWACDGPGLLYERTE